MIDKEKLVDDVFKKIILRYHAVNGRHNLPWRIDTSPYSVLVSEIMLQQTQVARVIDFYTKWMIKWPDIRSLANADLGDVLMMWKGLGYNSRAVRLHKLSKSISNEYRNIFPHTFKEIVALPGIGPYTAGALLNFSYQIPTPIIETNIRRVYIKHYFKDEKNIDDKQILPIISRTIHTKNPHIWFWALMDYGSNLPKITKNNANTQSKHYVKQSKFENSDRYFRSKILTYVLLHSEITIEELFIILDNDEERASRIIDKMIKEKLLTDTSGKFVLNKS